jgi:hypothetical protein
MDADFVIGQSRAMVSEKESQVGDIAVSQLETKILGIATSVRFCHLTNA